MSIAVDWPKVLDLFGITQHLEERGHPKRGTRWNPCLAGTCVFLEQGTSPLSRILAGAKGTVVYTQLL